MNFYNFFINQLTQRGVFEGQAKLIMDKVIANNPHMDGRWDELTINYPQQLTNIIWISVEQETLEFIKENCPQAWFRPIFDIDHPLRKEFEKQHGNI